MATGTSTSSFCVAATFVLMLAVHFVFGPRLAAARAASGGAIEPEAAGLERTALLLTALNLLACLGALIFTARMVWQLH